MTQILVTGGAGFIGSNFIQYMLSLATDEGLASEGLQILNVDALTYAGNLENLSAVAEDARYSFVKARIEDEDAMRGIFDAFKPEIVVNFAAESHVDRSIASSREFLISNVMGTQVLMDLSRQFDVKRYVQVSTDEVYGELGETGAFTEETPLAPSSPYSASKTAADMLVMSYVRTHGFPAMITRCSNNYGPYQFPEKLIPLMIGNAREDKTLPVYGQGLNVRDWIYVTDHCRGIAMAMMRGQDGEVYNFGGDAEMKNVDVVNEILRILDKPESLITYVTDRPGHDFRYAIDFSKAKASLGWAPMVDFATGLSQTVQWYLDNESWLEQVRSGAYQDYYAQHYEGRV